MPRRESRIERVVFRWTWAAVAFGTAALLWLVYLEQGSAGLQAIGRKALLSLAVLGKFVIFEGLAGGTTPPWELAVLVWVIDVWFAFILLSGLEGLERAPMLGAWLRRARARAVKVMTEYPGLDRMAFFGVALFVMLPIAATGAISGSFAARLIGLRRLTGVAAIALGSASTAATFALLAQFLGDRAEDLARSPILVGLTLLLLIVVGRSAYLRFLGKLKQGMPRRPAGVDSGDDEPGERTES